MRLIEGDCHEELKKLEDDSIDMVLTDPPYEILDLEWDQQPLDWELIWSELKRVGKDHIAYVFHASQPFASALITKKPELFKYEWIWEKEGVSNFQDANFQPLKIHEQVLVFGDFSINHHGVSNYNPQYKQRTKKYRDDRSDNNFDFKHLDATINQDSNRVYEKKYPKSIIHFHRDQNVKKTESFHPTQKPVDLLKFLIRTYTDEGDTVLDFTMGSGSTGVAAVNEGRDFVGIEQEEEYYDISKQRIENVEREREKKKQFFELNENNSDK